MGSVFRLADAFGCEEILFLGTTPKLNSRRLNGTSRATHKTVPYRFCEDLETTIQNLKTHGYQIIGLEITNESVPIQQQQFKNKVVLVIGSENYGIQPEVLKHLDHCVHIPMFGNNSSMNVASATAIGLYEVTNKIEN